MSNNDELTAYVEHQERAGQAHLVNSTDLPRRVHDRGGDQGYLDAGIVFGEPTNDLFRAATLPEGWRKQGSDHAMWSYVVDQHGRKRISIFYKAAFYDRDAFMSLENIDSYVNAAIRADNPEEVPIVLDDWTPAAALLEAVQEFRDSQVSRQEQMLAVYKGDLTRVEHYTENIQAADEFRARVEALVAAQGVQE